MKNAGLKYTIINPNTSMDTIRALQKIIIENMLREDDAMRPGTKPIPA